MRFAIIRNTAACIVLIVAMVLYALGNYTGRGVYDFVALFLQGYVIAVMLVNANAFSYKMRDLPPVFTERCKYFGMTCLYDETSNDLVPDTYVGLAFGILLFPILEVFGMLGNVILSWFGIQPIFAMVETLERIEPPMVGTYKVRRVFGGKNKKSDSEPL